MQEGKKNHKTKQTECCAWVAPLVPKVLASVCHLTWVSFFLIPAFSSLSHRAGEQALPHPTRREMSSVMGCCPLPRTAPRGRETGLKGHTPGLWMTSQASGGCGVLLHAAVAVPLFSPRLRDHFQVTVLPRYWPFWDVGICFFR